MKKNTVFFCFCMMLMTSPLFAQRLTDFKGIIIPEKTTVKVRGAAEDLRYHLAKIRGTDIPIGSIVSEGSSLYFFVGAESYPAKKGAVESLGRESFLMQTLPEGILLAGNDSLDPSGTVYAVSVFLESKCGVRWLWPGVSGEVIPRNPKLNFSSFNERHTPGFVRRKLDFYYGRFWSDTAKKDLAVWRNRSCLGDTIRGSFGHAWGRLIPASLYFEKHPEWFSLVAGKRVTNQLCISNPELREELLKRLLTLPANQKLDIVSISANDGYGFCECDLCRAKGSTNDAYWDFAKWVAERVKKDSPERGVGTFAYSEYRDPPEKIATLPDNIYLSMTTYAATHMIPETLERFKAFMNSWKNKGIKIVMREYWGTHYFLDLPVLYPREIMETVILGKQAGLIGVYGEAGKNFATMAPNYYALTHILWNPSENPEKILDSFYEAFGPAKKEVRGYFETLEKAVHEEWRKRNLALGYSSVVQAYGYIFSPDLLARAGVFLDKAEKIAEKDQELKAKIAFLKTGFEYTSILSELLTLYDKLGKTGFPLEFFEWEATAQRRREAVKNPEAEYGREIFDARLKEPFTWTLQEKDGWLLRAWELGQKRIALYNAHRDESSIDEGLYAQTLKAKIRQWHQTVGYYLGIPVSEIIPLEYTGADDTNRR
ncbi:MAG: DUF4838 domain-containing protein [Candidatus Ratteibacteria bacterium]|jgi:hypothetical protein